MVGQWEKAYPSCRSSKPDRVLSRFANWSTNDEQILRFTRKYGPLTEPVVGRGRRFSFGLAQWRRAHEEFCALWDEQMTFAGKGYLLGGDSLSFPADAGDELDFAYRQWSYITSTLERWLRLELLSAPTERLRRCAKPGCQTPFFIASHGRQAYCSKRCAAWVQRLAKAKWARENYGKAHSRVGRKKR